MFGAQLHKYQYTEKLCPGLTYLLKNVKREIRNANK